MIESKPIYLDYNATTPCAPEVMAAMSSFFAHEFANPSSSHLMGRKAARAVSEARSLVARTIGAEEGDVYFTSGATESNNVVLLGLLQRRTGRQRIVVTAIEHKSVLGACHWLCSQGYDIAEIPVTPQGVLDLTVAERLITENTLLVCVQAANNEVGTVQPVRAVAQIAHRRGALIHCDASQMLGKVAVSVADLDIDTAAFSSHKTYGPKGIGAVFIRSRVRELLTPVYRGGGQESEVRPGTLNVPAIVGFGAACVAAAENVEQDRRRATTLRDSLEARLLARCANAFAIGRSAERLPNTSNICFAGIPADALLAQTPLVCAGTGSACSSGSISPSHVLLACGLTRDEARSAVRFSLGRYTTEEEIVVTVEQIAGAVATLRSTGCV